MKPQMTRARFLMATGHDYAQVAPMEPHKNKRVSLGQKTTTPAAWAATPPAEVNLQKTLI